MNMLRLPEPRNGDKTMYEYYIQVLFNFLSLSKNKFDTNFKHYGINDTAKRWRNILAQTFSSLLGQIHIIRILANRTKCLDTDNCGQGNVHYSPINVMLLRNFKNLFCNFLFFAYAWKRLNNLSENFAPPPTFMTLKKEMTLRKGNQSWKLVHSRSMVGAFLAYGNLQILTIADRLISDLRNIINALITIIFASSSI